MSTIILIGALIVFALSVTVRLIVFNFPSVIRYGFKDAFRWICRHGWNNAPYGTIKMYIAHNSISFGCGKTLSAIKEIVEKYNRYNNRIIYDPDRKKDVVQRVVILSNVDILSVPFTRLVSLSQFVQMTEDINERDKENDTFTVLYMLIDEASSQLNSRSFKSNFDPPFISRLLTSRHVHANLILTSQRSGMVDKLMRDCCNVYITCKKLWRFEYLRFYDAYKVECTQDINVVSPIRRSGYFIRDSLFKNYDTLSSVKALQKSCQEGDMLSEDEILALRVDNPVLTGGFSKRELKRYRKSKGGK